MMGNFNCEFTRLSICDRLFCMHNLITEYNFVVSDEMTLISLNIPIVMSH